VTATGEERVAIVTGGCGGLGAAIADGLRVAVADLDAAGREGADDDDGLFDLDLDVTDQASTRALAASVGERFGRIDVLVNAAGIAGETATVADYRLEEFRRVLEVNLVGVFNCTQACLPELEKGEAARIVNVASVAGRDPNPRMSAYSASKAGVIAFTRSLAKELVGTGVLANCLVPGVIDAGLTDRATAEERETFLSRVPLGRMGRAEEIAELVSWMASPRCSFTTGATFDASGGRSPV
jgi:NAD(P)-dependent dehydrogenase (short-subunit alcohol dehydrogenase family)